jgi:aminoglycoside phosphotransferase (APT) family kinase protein
LPEQEVPPPLAARLIERRFPSLCPVHIERLGEGWDNVAYRVNGSLVFRFPQRSVAVGLLQTEIAALPALAPDLPLAVPVPDLVGEPALGYPWPFAGYRMLPGRTADHAALDSQARSALAVVLGEFLAALHAVPASTARRHGVPPDEHARLVSAQRVPQARERLGQLLDLGLVDHPGPLLTIIESARGLDATSQETVVHGDLYARHLLLDGDARASGVIDWGDLHLGDPAIDLALAHTFLPPRSHEAFRDAYGGVDDATWRLARFRALGHSLATAAYAQEVRDEPLLRECRTAISFLSSG